MGYSKAAEVFCMVLVLTSQAFSQELVHSKDGMDGGTDYEDYNYGPIVCLNDEFKCLSEDLCISNTSKCDSRFDCSDNSDELNCTFPDTQPSTTALPDYEDCEDNEFDCGEGECFPTSVLCDSVQDCADGRDEINCPVPPTTATIPLSTFPDYEGCDQNEFECDGGVCVAITVRCDGFNDCSDLTDEMGCLPETTTTKTATTASITSARPFTEGSKCLYEDVYYPANTQILITNCTEVFCSPSGHLITWNSDDLTCSGFTIKPTFSVPYLILVSVLISWLR